jgi:oxygen-dependent protoporphyrinogen oxidase
MSGIYNADANQQSMLATFPRFRMIEKQHRSLTLGMLASKRKRAGAQPPAGQKKMSAFVSLQKGTEKLIDALAAKLDGDMRLNTGVNTIQKQGDQYSITLDNGDILHADAVVLTTPAYITADLLGDVSPQSVDGLKQIRYVSTGTISFAFKTSDIKKPLDGFGVVIPSSENRPINAITISSTKFDNRAPEGYVLMRAFFGGSRSPESMNLSDDDLVATIRKELESILGITAEPLFHRIYRWWNANPQYDLGHLERVDAIESSLPDGIYITGSSYRGVGMPDCVHQSQLTIDKVSQDLHSKA